VSTLVTASLGTRGFVAALEGHGAGLVIEAGLGLVIYTVTPVSGALAGQPVRTAVNLEELAPWPVAPPHWIHLPEAVVFRATNAGASPKAGWLSHSRDIPAWGTAASPAGAWLAHVRGVLGGAV
jgi:hypothetical protein